MTSILSRLRSLSTLQWAILVSVAVHALLLTIRFADPERFNRIFQDTPLEVILVNTQSMEAPEKAQAIAQASLAGGGDSARAEVRASSPLPYSGLTAAGEDPEEVQRRLQAMALEQTRLLTRVREKLQAELAAQPPESRDSNNANEQAQEAKRQEKLKLLAEIERRINEENARPRRRYISPATREEAYALYYDGLRRKIEDRGTINFPQLSGKKLYGELMMSIIVNHDGRVLDTQIEQSSGSITLDSRAQAIARSAGPFGAFNSAMRQRADQIVIVSRFRFTRDNTLEATAQ